MPEITPQHKLQKLASCDIVLSQQPRFINFTTPIIVSTLND